MNVTGIVSEFNPFHNGHSFLVERARENGATHIVTVMGGSFLQRGECAVMSKYSRARAAVLGGVDLVLELPQVFACASAEGFAKGAVSTLRACGCVDTICCGSENMPPMAVMLRAAQLLKSAQLSEYLKKGYSYPRAAQAALEELGEAQAAELLRYPNDVLALEYFKESIDDFSFLRVRRTAPHNGAPVPNGSFCSASAIREMIKSGGDFRKYVPDTTAKIINEAIERGECPASLENNERGIITVLRRMTEDDFRTLPDVTEGLENRLVRAVRENDTLEGILTAAKCKRYTHARLSRIITCAYLGITRECADVQPQYIRVLAFNERGTEILKEMKKTAALPVLTTARSFKALDENARAMLDIDLRASDLFALCTPIVQRCGEDFYTGAERVSV